MTDWERLADWWVVEVESDPEYRRTVLPLAVELVAAEPGELLIDLGCGEGRVMASLAAAGARVVGCDLTHQLLGRAAIAGPVVRSALPGLGWIKSNSVDGAVVVLVLEHLQDDVVLAEAFRVVRPGGRLVVVVNHPVITSAGSAPVVDPRDDEILWRFGDYFGSGTTMEPAGERSITFHHRSMGRLLNAAASAGWVLERLEERGGDPDASDGLVAAQAGIPRVAGLRWRRP